MTSHLYNLKQPSSAALRPKSPNISVLAAKPRLLSRWAMAALMAGVSLAAHGQTSYWTNAASGDVWSDTKGWSNAVPANGAGNTAFFTNAPLSAGYIVHLDTARTIGNITIGDASTNATHNWTLDNNGDVSGTVVLTLAGTNGGSSTINCAMFSTSAATISSPIAGTTALVKAGASPLYLTGLSTYSAPTTVSAGNLYVNSISSVAGGPTASALGAPTTMANGQINLGVSSGYLYYSGPTAATDRTIDFTSQNISLYDNAVSSVLTLNGLITNSGAGNQFQFRGGVSGSGFIVNGQVACGVANILGNSGGGGGAYVAFYNPSNSFTGFLDAAAGTVNYASVANIGVPSAAGAGTNLESAGNGSVMAYVGTNNSATTRTYMFAANNAQFANNSPNGSTLTLNGVMTNTLATAGQAVIRGTANTVINGPIFLNSEILYKIDFGTVYLNNPTNSFTNYVQVATGALYFNTITNTGVPCSLGENTNIYFLPSATSTAHYDYTGGTASSDRAWVLQTVSPSIGPCYIGNYGTGTLTLNGSLYSQSADMQREVDFEGVNNITYNGVITLNPSTFFGPIVGLNQNGTGVLTLSNPANYIPGPLIVNSGTINVTSTSAMGGASGIQLGNGTTSGTFKLTEAANDASGAPITISAGTLANAVAGTTFTLSGSVTAGGSPSSLTLAGAGNGVLNAGISSSPDLNVTMTGSGTWTLSGYNNYTGTTTVSNGTLAVIGNIGSGANSLVAGGTLAGVFTNADSLTVLAGGTLAPGTNQEPDLIGIGGNLSLSGAVAITVNKSAALSNSLVSVGGSLANAGGGSILVSNTGPALAAGDTFAIFSQAVANGAAMTISPAPGAGLAWTNNLAENGSIAVVVASGPSGPGYITNRFSGNNLTLTWPAGQGWRLVGETNSLSVGLTTTNVWQTVPGGMDGSNSIMVNPANPTVFYKLVNP